MPLNPTRQGLYLHDPATDSPPNLSDGSFKVGLLDGGNATQGSQADAAWGGSGNGSVVAVLKALYSKLSGYLLVNPRPLSMSVDMVTAACFNGLLQNPTAVSASCPTPGGSTTTAIYAVVANNDPSGGFGLAYDTIPTQSASLTVPVTTNGTNLVSVAWSGVPGALGYKLLKNTAGAGWKLLGSTNASTLTYTDNAGAAGSIYAPTATNPLGPLAVQTAANTPLAVAQTPVLLQPSLVDGSAFVQGQALAVGAHTVVFTPPAGQSVRRYYLANRQSGLTLGYSQFGALTAAGSGDQLAYGAAFGEDALLSTLYLYCSIGTTLNNLGGAGLWLYGGSY